tara:strand:+ start:152 stop:445 length:294 start_codon:yes stop_codon:yes gene_type:complete
MNYVKSKEEVVNNSNQPQKGKSKIEILRSKHPKGKTMDEIQWLYFYSSNKEFLQLEGVKKTIKVIVDYHKSEKLKYVFSSRNRDNIISLGERLLKNI